MHQGNQRGNFKKGDLSSDRIERLENIGFKWEIREEQLEEQFEKGFQETLLYKERIGNPNAPLRYETAEGYNLGVWQRNRRDNYKKRELSLDKIEKLEEIGFTWEILEEQFEKGFQETLLYKESTGNPNAPNIYETDEGFRLGAWQGNQRGNYKKGKLSPDRIERLDKIGFIWDILEEQFEKGFQETLLYKNRTGDSNVPQSYKTDEGYRLGTWQATQRKNYKEDELSSDRLKRLEDIGFKWEILEEQFEKGFQETLLYKESTGNPNAPQIYKTDKGYHLGTWQVTQKYNYKKGNLSPDRIARLEEIGFKWEIQEEQFEKQFEKGFQETLLYKNSTGNPNAPASYRTTEGYNLGVWQSNQRGNYKKGNLSSDRIERFEKIGFSWEKFEEQFEKGFQETLLYKNSTGNPNAPASYRTAEGYRLGYWQSTQRGNYKKGKLSSDRIEQLEKIGFSWEILEEQFEKGFQETLLYKESTGDPNAPKSYKTAEGYHLGTWQCNRKGNYRKGELSSDRIKRLEEIGFRWGMRS
jgi:hypothetical protein